MPAARDYPRLAYDSVTAYRAMASAWPRGEQPGPACPETEAGDTVRHADTQGCTLASKWVGMCPCAAVLGGWDNEWTGFAADGAPLARHGER